MIALACCAPTPISAAKPCSLKNNGKLADHKTVPAAYDVFDGGTLVLQIVDKPGSLVSTAPPPPTGATEVRHPFLSAVATSPVHEDKLRTLLEGATSTADYLARLRAAGFRVKKTP